MRHEVTLVAYTTSTGHETVIPTSSYSFNTTSGGTLSLTYNAFNDHNDDSGHYGHIEYRLYIDNTLVGMQSWEHNPNGSAAVTINGYKSIVAGAHAIELGAYQIRSYKSVTLLMGLYQSS